MCEVHHDLVPGFPFNWEQRINYNARNHQDHTQPSGLHATVRMTRNSGLHATIRITRNSGLPATIRITRFLKVSESFCSRQPMEQFKHINQNSPCFRTLKPALERSHHHLIYLTEIGDTTSFPLNSDKSRTLLQQGGGGVLRKIISPIQSN